MATITLYKNSSADNVINKSISEVASYNINIKASCSIMMPTIVLDDSAALSCNYAYIDTFQRYYFIKTVDVQPGGLCVLQLKEDVLYTYKDSIKKLTAIISRQENLYNLYLPDSEFKVLAYNNKKTVPFSSPFTKDLQFVLTVNGGV